MKDIHDALAKKFGNPGVSWCWRLQSGARHSLPKSCSPRVNDERRLWEAIPDIPDLQCAWQVLLQSANPKATRCALCRLLFLSLEYSRLHDEGIWGTALALIGQLPGTALRSGLTGEDNGHPGAADCDGAVLAQAHDDKERTHPEIATSERCKLVVMAIDRRTMQRGSGPRAPSVGACQGQKKHFFSCASQSPSRGSAVGHECWQSLCANAFVASLDRAPPLRYRRFAGPPPASSHAYQKERLLDWNRVPQRNNLGPGLFRRSYDAATQEWNEQLDSRPWARRRVVRYIPMGLPEASIGLSLSGYADDLARAAVAKNLTEAWPDQTRADGQSSSCTEKPSVLSSSILRKELFFHVPRAATP